MLNRFARYHACRNVSGTDFFIDIDIQFCIYHIYNGHLVSFPINKAVCQRIASRWKVISILIRLKRWRFQLFSNFKEWLKKDTLSNQMHNHWNWRCCVIGLVAISIAWIPSIASFHSSQLFVYIQVCQKLYIQIIGMQNYFTYILSSISKTATRNCYRPSQTFLHRL